MSKAKTNWIRWLFETDSNLMNSLNLMGLAITTYGVMYVLPQNSLKNVLGIAAIGFIVLGFFQIIVSVVNLCGKNEQKR